mmetsp:Transcript_49594/g.160220  ORF Transcript_49594/g.160220 Transcript_49594/m.160220 type:complete len:283 (+) Transcript_49594:2-850(+)
MQALLCRRPRAALRHLPPATRAYLAAGQQQVAPSGARAKIAAWIVGGSPLYTEVIARQGFDAVVVDQQHGTGEVVPLLQAIDAARDAAGNAPLAVVRIEELSDGAIAKALDAGAAALICPMINSVEECEAFVRATKFPPAGHRSYGPHRAALGWEGSRGDWTRASNTCVQSFAMLETRGALEDLDAILSVDGLSGIFVGPNDLGLALGHDPTDSPEGEVLEAVRHALRLAHAHGRQAAIFCADPATARRMADEGFDLVVAGIDLGWAASGAASALAGVRGAS